MRLILIGVACLVISGHSAYIKSGSTIVFKVSHGDTKLNHDGHVMEGNNPEGDDYQHLCTSEGGCGSEARWTIGWEEGGSDLVSGETKVWLKNQARNSYLHSNGCCIDSGKYWSWSNSPGDKRYWWVLYWEGDMDPNTEVGIYSLEAKKVGKNGFWSSQPANNENLKWVPNMKDGFLWNVINPDNRNYVGKTTVTTQTTSTVTTATTTTTTSHMNLFEKKNADRIEELAAEIETGHAALEAADAELGKAGTKLQQNIDAVAAAAKAETAAAVGQLYSKDQVDSIVSNAVKALEGKIAAVQAKMDASNAGGVVDEGSNANDVDLNVAKIEVDAATNDLVLSAGADNTVRVAPVLRLGKFIDVEGSLNRCIVDQAGDAAKIEYLEQAVAELQAEVTELKD